MDAGAMALPPSKRRKLSSYVQDDAPTAEHEAAVGDRSQAFPHAVEPLEEVKWARPMDGGYQGQQMFLRRQATDLPSATASTPAALSTGGGSTASMATTSAPPVAITSDTSTSSAASTSPDLALSLSLGVSVSLPDIASIATELPVSLVSGLLSGVSGFLTPSASSTTLPNEATTTPSLSSSAPNDTTSISSTSSANDTTSIPSSSSVTSTNGANTTASSLISSSTGFITSSFSRNSTITSSLSGSQSSSSSSSSSSTESALAFIATLSRGDVTTLSRSADAYTTTFDGNTFTVAAASTSSSHSFASSSSLAGSSSSGGRQTVVSTITTDGGDGSGSQYTATSYAAPNSTTAPASNSGSGSSTPPAGTIAGGVVGGAAGLAVIVLIAMLAVRWYRRQGTQHQALPQGPGNSPDPNAASSSGPGMAERAGLAPFAVAVPALFRHQNRDAEGGETGQRGFTRVAGRKLPSAYSGGLGIEPPVAAPVNREAESDINNTSFYRDSDGSYGGDGAPRSASSLSGSFPLRSNSHEHMTISPGPQRMPKVHSGGPYDMSPGPSSTQVASTLTRSDAPFLLDPNRNSRFSEGL